MAAVIAGRSVHPATSFQWPTRLVKANPSAEWKPYTVTDESKKISTLSDDVDDRIYGSDIIADALREQGFPYICLNPGAS